MRLALFVALYLAAVALGRATRLDGTQLALVWPAAGVAFLWLASGWNDPARRRLDLVGLFLATVAGNFLTGAVFSLSLAFGVANLVMAVVSVLVFARLRPNGLELSMTRPEDVRALLFGVGGRRGRERRDRPAGRVAADRRALAGRARLLAAAQRHRHAGDRGRRPAPLHARDLALRARAGSSWP